MSSIALTQAMATTGIGRLYGMDEIVTLSLIDWIFQGQYGELCVLELGKIENGSAMIKVTMSD